MTVQTHGLEVELTSLDRHSSWTGRFVGDDVATARKLFYGDTVTWTVSNNNNK